MNHCRKYFLIPCLSFAYCPPLKLKVTKRRRCHWLPKRTAANKSTSVLCTRQVKGVVSSPQRATRQISLCTWIYRVRTIKCIGLIVELLPCVNWMISSGLQLGMVGNINWVGGSSVSDSCMPHHEVKMKWGTFRLMGVNNIVIYSIFLCEYMKTFIFVFGFCLIKSYEIP